MYSFTVVVQTHSQASYSYTDPLSIQFSSSQLIINESNDVSHHFDASSILDIFIQKYNLDLPLDELENGPWDPDYISEDDYGLPF